jgi:copper chaperone
MGKIQLNVAGMSCGHCARAVEGAVGALAGVSRVVVNLAEKTVAVECDQTPLELIRSAIEGQGFEVTP